MDERVIAARLEMVSDRLGELRDMSRVGHYRAAWVVLQSLGEYSGSHAKSDHDVIDEAIKTGVQSLAPIRKHKDLWEIDPADHWMIGNYLERYITSDVECIDEAVCALASEGVYAL